MFENDIKNWELLLLVLKVVFELGNFDGKP